MTVTEAIQYCKSHECENCPVYYLANDIRTNYEQKELHYLCAINLTRCDRETLNVRV